MSTKTAWGVLGVLYLLGGAFYMIAGAAEWSAAALISGKSFPYLLLGIAGLIEGVSLLFGYFNWTASKKALLAGNNNSVSEQLSERLVVWRWVTWGITDSLMFVVLAAIAGFQSKDYFLAAVAFIGMGIAYAQSANEAENCGREAVSEGQTGEMTGRFYRSGGWLVAFAQVVFLIVIFAIRFEDRCVGEMPAQGRFRRQEPQHLEQLGAEPLEIGPRRAVDVPVEILGGRGQ